MWSPTVCRIGIRLKILSISDIRHHLGAVGLSDRVPTRSPIILQYVQAQYWRFLKFGLDQVIFIIIFVYSQNVAQWERIRHEIWGTVIESGKGELS